LHNILFIFPVDFGGKYYKNVFHKLGPLFLVLEIRIRCYIPENKSTASTLAVVTEVKDSFSGKILTVLSHNISTTNVCSRDEGPLQQATDL
jgi:hypothetical protein